MSQDKVEVVKLGLAAWEGSGDFTTALSSFDEAVVVRRVSPLPDPGTWTGREGLLDVVAEWIQDFDEFERRAEEYIDVEGDQVIVRVAQEARGGSGGVPVEATFWFLYEVKDSQVTRLEMYAHRSQALEAVEWQARGP